MATNNVYILKALSDYRDRKSPHKKFNRAFGNYISLKLWLCHTRILRSTHRTCEPFFQLNFLKNKTYVFFKNVIKMAFDRKMICPVRVDIIHGTKLGPLKINPYSTADMQV